MFYRIEARIFAYNVSKWSAFVNSKYPFLQISLFPLTNQLFKGRIKRVSAFATAFRSWTNKKKKTRPALAAEEYAIFKNENRAQAPWEDLIICLFRLKPK